MTTRHDHIGGEQGDSLTCICIKLNISVNYTDRHYIFIKAATDVLRHIPGVAISLDTGQFKMLWNLYCWYSNNEMSLDYVVAIKQHCWHNTGQYSTYAGSATAHGDTVLISAIEGSSVAPTGGDDNEGKQT
jgi:hypothetical protein